MHPIRTTQDIPAALRDFFGASTAAEMAGAYGALAAGGDSPPAPHDWGEVEFAFNRLFVGPGPLEAPPYASVYLEDQPRLMGRTGLLVRAVNDTLGLSAPGRGGTPDDHVALELDTALALGRLARARPGDAAVAVLRHYFLADHMALWIPEFTNRIVLACSVPTAISFAAWKLRKWVEAERAVTADGDAVRRPARQGGRA
jgi:TorA maturation chaperone TorD